MNNLYSYDITFKEVPGKVSLTLAFSGCVNKCKGCHSPWLQGDEGDEFDIHLLSTLLKTYSKHVDVVTFLGGEVWAQDSLVADLIKAYDLDICLYTGFDHIRAFYVRYLKTGSYIEALGGLDSPNTNQQLWDLKENKQLFKNNQAQTQ